MRKFYLDYWNEKLLHLGGKDGGGGIAYLLSAMSIQLIAGIISLGWLGFTEKSHSRENITLNTVCESPKHVVLRTPTTEAWGLRAEPLPLLLHRVCSETTSSLS